MLTYLLDHESNGSFMTRRYHFASVFPKLDLLESFKFPFHGKALEEGVILMNEDRHVFSSFWLAVFVLIAIYCKKKKQL